MKELNQISNFAFFPITLSLSGTPERHFVTILFLRYCPLQPLDVPELLAIYYGMLPFLSPFKTAEED